MRISTQTVTRRILPGLILGFVVLIGLALLGDLQEVSKLLLQFNWMYFLGAILFTLVNYALRFLKWHYYLVYLGIRSIRVLQSLRMFVAGFPLAVTPGKVGEGLKGVWLNRISSLPIGRGISVVLAERISDGLAVLILSTLGVVSYPQYWPAFLLIMSALLLIIVVSQIRPLALWLIDLGERLPLVNRLASGIHEFYEGSFSLFRPGVLLLAVGLGVVSWLAEGIGFYLILLGLGVEPSKEMLATAIFVLSFSTAVGAASALPGGLGAAEISIAGMLTLMAGLPPATATSATLLIRLATLWFGVTLGLVTWMFSMDLLGMQSEQDMVMET